MIIRVKKWLKERQRRKDEEAERNGFGWAMAAFYLEGKTLEEIEGYYWQSDRHYSPFDRGADQVVFMLRRQKEEEGQCIFPT